MNPHHRNEMKINTLPRANKQKIIGTLPDNNGGLVCCSSRRTYGSQVAGNIPQETDTSDRQVHQHRRHPVMSTYLFMMALLLRSSVTSQLGRACFPPLPQVLIESFFCRLAIFAFVYHILYALENRENVQPEKILNQRDSNP